MRPTPLNLDRNDAFNHAVDLMQNTRRNLFITGKAGTGKSTLLDFFILNSPKHAVVLAPTGVAALNVRGQTIHRFFTFYPDTTPEKVRQKTYRPRNTKLMGKLDTMIIDEISMVRADLLDCIDAALQIYGPVPGSPFGGVQMIFVGDMYQLPPVVGREEENIFNTSYPSPYFFSAHAMHDVAFDMIELDKVYRQKDRDFVDLLNRIRNNTVGDDDLKLLNTRVIRNSPSAQAEGPVPLAAQNLRAKPEGLQQDLTITLTTTNAAADGVNDAALTALPGRTYRHVAEISGDFTKEYYPTATDLSFKIGAQIMMLNNETKKKWVNGTMGVITAFQTDDDGNDYVAVRLEGERDDVKVYPFMWEVFKFKVIDGHIASEAVGTFTQFPFRLAWAVTIHKSQGKTFDHVIVDVGRGAFATGQIYVALSRCTSFEGLQLRTPLLRHNIRTDHRITTFFREYAARHDDPTTLLHA